MIQNTAKDPRCPHCGRPVLGIYLEGVEGRYHPSCAQGVQQDYVPHPYCPMTPTTEHFVRPPLGPLVTQGTSCFELPAYPLEVHDDYGLNRCR